MKDYPVSSYTYSSFLWFFHFLGVYPPITFSYYVRISTRVFGMLVHVSLNRGIENFSSVALYSSLKFLMLFPLSSPKYLKSLLGSSMIFDSINVGIFLFPRVPKALILAKILSKLTFSRFQKSVTQSVVSQETSSYVSRLALIWWTSYPVSFSFSFTLIIFMNSASSTLSP